MPLQTIGKKLVPNTATLLLSTATGVQHGFADVLISNFGSTDAHVYIHITKTASPGQDDIVAPNVTIPPNESHAISCMPIDATESVYATSDSGNVTVRCTILGKANVSTGT